MDKIEADGLLMTSDGGMLLTHTSSGWKAIGSYTETSQGQVPEVVDAMPGYGQTWDQQLLGVDGQMYHVPAGKKLVSRTATVAKTHFVLQKDEKSVIAELTARTNIAEASSSKAAADLDAEKKAHAETEKKRAALAECADKQVQYADMHRRERDEERTRNRKLETDLGKIQKAIGDLEYKRILGLMEKQ